MGMTDNWDQMKPVFGAGDDNLKDRWAQQGSTQFNISHDGSSQQSYTLKTVTAGKTVYVTDIELVAHQANAYFKLYDNTTASGTVPWVQFIPNSMNPYSFHFSTPLKFTTGVTAYTGGASPYGFAITIIGWEE